MSVCLCECILMFSHWAYPFSVSMCVCMCSIYMSANAHSLFLSFTRKQKKSNNREMISIVVADVDDDIENHRQCTFEHIFMCGWAALRFHTNIRIEKRAPKTTRRAKGTILSTNSTCVWVSVSFYWKNMRTNRHIVCLYFSLVVFFYLFLCECFFRRCSMKIQMESFGRYYAVTWCVRA